MFYKKLKEIVFSIILFSLFGCVESYYDKNPKLIESKTVDFCKELKVEIVEKSEKKVIFHLWTEDFEEVQDSLLYEVFYCNTLFWLEGKKYEETKKELGASTLVGILLGIGSITIGNAMAGCSEGLSELGAEDDNSADLFYIMGGCSIIGGIASLYQMSSLERRKPKVKIVTRKKKRADGFQNLALEPVRVSLFNTEFVNNYKTDSEGNLSVIIEDIIPYLPEGCTEPLFQFLYKDLSDSKIVDLKK